MAAAALEEYLQNGDSQLLLVALTQSIGCGHCEDVAGHLIQPKYRSVVEALGWDLLPLLTLHISHTVTPSPVWQLITLISETCSAKEMCLAFLEQLELASASPPLFFHLLTPLHTVMVRLGVGDGGRHVSTLSSVRQMVATVYPTLEESEGEDSFSPSTAAGLVVALVEPFTTHLHHQFTNQLAPLQTFWSPLQRECVCLLLTLLGQPLVSHTLREGSEDRRAAEIVMSRVVECHCGCLQLLECGGEEVSLPSAHQATDDEDDILPFAVPLVGVACFAYLLLVEGVQCDYLPSPVHPHHLLHTSLTHTLTLLHRQERQAVLKGLLLLESGLGHVATGSLQRELLGHSCYLSTAQTLVDIMVSFPHKKLRQMSVSLLPSLVQRFTSFGRHKLYRVLLRGSLHAGVQGFLIHCLKNEVDLALLSGAVSSPFLGPELIPMLRDVLTFSTDSELLRESDRVMAALNFLRYLLIRDRPDSDKTGVWGMVNEVRSEFITPLRQSLESSQLQVRGERASQMSGSVGAGEGPAVTVEVQGEILPGVSPEEQLKVLQLAEHQLDMIECVLVRVEELLDNRS